MTLNKMMIIGNLGADPELRYTPSGKAVANLRVAVNDRYRGQDGEWQEETHWFRVELWEQAAERAAENMRKGHKVYAEGQLRPREFEGKDGEKRTSLEIRFARVQSPSSGATRVRAATRAASARPVAAPRTRRWRARAGPARRPQSRDRREHRRRRHPLLSQEDRIATWQAHVPAASRRTTTATGVAARCATSASTRPSRLTTRRSTASADTSPSERRSSRVARPAPALGTSGC